MQLSRRNKPSICVGENKTISLNEQANMEKKAFNSFYSLLHLRYIANIMEI